MPGFAPASRKRRAVELPAQQPRWIQYLDRAVAFGALDDAVQQAGSIGPGAGIVLLNRWRQRREPVGPIDHEADRVSPRTTITRVDLVRVQYPANAASPQAHHRHDNAAQIGQTEQARRHQRHMGQFWQPDDFGDVVKPKSERLTGELKDQELGARQPLLARQGSTVRRTDAPLPCPFPSASHCGAECFRRARRSLRLPPQDLPHRGPVAWPRPPLAPTRWRLPRQPTPPAARPLPTSFIEARMASALARSARCRRRSGHILLDDLKSASTASVFWFSVSRRQSRAPVRAARPRSDPGSPNRVLDAPGILPGIAGEAADVFRDDGEPLAEFTCARGLHRSAHRQHVGLDRHHADPFNDLLDVAADVFKTGDQSRL